MTGRGQPKKFSQEEFKDICLEYFDVIYQSQTNEDVISEPPTFFGLYKFANAKKKCSYHTIRRCFDEYWADIKKEFEEMRADLLIRGSSIGQYNPTITIFALKNWCSWSDRTETVQLTADDVKQDALSKSLEDMAEELTSDD